MKWNQVTLLLSCGSYDNHHVNTTSWHAIGKPNAFLISQQAKDQYHDITTIIQTLWKLTMPGQLISLNNQHSWSAKFDVAPYLMIYAHCV